MEIEHYELVAMRTDVPVLLELILCKLGRTPEEWMGGGEVNPFTGVGLMGCTAACNCSMVIGKPASEEFLPWLAMDKLNSGDGAAAMAESMVVGTHHFLKPSHDWRQHAASMMQPVGPSPCASHTFA